MSSFNGTQTFLGSLVMINISISRHYHAQEKMLLSACGYISMWGKKKKNTMNWSIVALAVMT